MNRVIKELLEKPTWEYKEPQMISKEGSGKKVWDGSEDKAVGNMEMYFMGEDGLATFEVEEEAANTRSWGRGDRRTFAPPKRTGEMAAAQEAMNDAMSGKEVLDDVELKPRSNRRSHRGTARSRRGTGNAKLQFNPNDVIKAVADAAKAETIAAILSVETQYDR